MQIIPVLDLKGTTVVHAKGGNRALYPPLTSILTESCQLFSVVADLSRHTNLPIFYLADLNAIETGYEQRDVYQQLAVQFPKITFWLDGGFHDFSQSGWLNTLPNFLPVMGSETMQVPHGLRTAPHRNYILSLDFKEGQFLGNPNLLSQSNEWPKQVIVMNLDAVGSQQGPGIKQLEQFVTRENQVQFIASGGVRHQQDLIDLQAIGIHFALVASALHNGQLQL